MRVNVTLLGSMKMKLKNNEFSIFLPEDSSLQDLISSLSNRLGDVFEAEFLKPFRESGQALYVLIVNGVSIRPEKWKTLTLKEGDSVVFAPLLIAGG